MILHRRLIPPLFLLLSLGLSGISFAGDFCSKALTAPVLAIISGAGLVPTRAENLTIYRDDSDRLFHDSSGQAIPDGPLKARIGRLGIPDSYREVRVTEEPTGHIQYIGKDSRGRWQYRYHPLWIAAKSSVKFSHLADFGEALPRIRAQVEEDIRAPGLPRQRVMAAIVRLLDRTAIRIGHEKYAEENDTYGLTTFERKVVRIDGDVLFFDFVGKDSVEHHISLEDSEVAAVVRDCLKLPGDKLWRFGDGVVSSEPISAEAVNEYLKTLSGKKISAKNFRTWVGTTTALGALLAEPVPNGVRAASAAIARSIVAASKRLGNTPGVCRAKYVDPSVLSAFRDRDRFASLAAQVSGISDPREKAEAALLWLLTKK